MRWSVWLVVGCWFVWLVFVFSIWWGRIGCFGCWVYWFCVMDFCCCLVVCWWWYLGFYLRVWFVCYWFWCWYFWNWCLVWGIYLENFSVGDFFLLIVWCVWVLNCLFLFCIFCCWLLVEWWIVFWCWCLILGLGIGWWGSCVGCCWLWWWCLVYGLGVCMCSVWIVFVIWFGCLDFWCCDFLGMFWFFWLVCFCVGGMGLVRIVLVFWRCVCGW